MKISQFEIHLASYGTDLARWPSALRDAAEALVAASEEARALLRSEERLEALFVDTIPPAPNAASITLRATARSQSRPVPLLAQLLGPRQPLLGWARVVTLASCLCVGIMIGVLSPTRHHDSNMLDLIDGSAFEVNDE